MFKNQLKIAWRNLRKRKVFSVINILGLALGFGCSIMIYLFVNHHLQYDNFHEDSDRVYRIVTEEQRDEIEYESAVPPGFVKGFMTDYDFAENTANLVNWENYILTLTEDENKQFQENIAFTTADFFKILNFPLVDGLSNKSLDEPNTAYITQSLAKKMYGTENPLGKSFILENLETFEIIGVLRDLPKTSSVKREAFVSLKSMGEYFAFGASDSWGGISSNMQCYTKLKPNQDAAHIEKTLIELVDKHRPTSKNVHRYKLQPIEEVHFNADYSGAINTNLLWIFALIGFFLIAIACINFVNISTAQAFTRSREIGVKKVLGSYRHHLFWQFITETTIISIVALFIGIGFVLLVVPSFNNQFNIELSMTALVAPKFIIFTVVLLLGVSFFAGSYPGILLARIVPTLALKGKLTQRDTGGNMSRKVLVTAQFVISIVLIAATIIVSKQINYAVNSDLGFDTDAVVMLEIPEDIEGERLVSLQDRIQNLAGVSLVTNCLSSPGASENRWGTSFRFHNRDETEEFSIQAKLADNNYLDVFGLELIAGRNFYPTDTITEVVVNKILAKKLGLSSVDELLGKRIQANGGQIQSTIVGVVADFHDQSFHDDINPVFIGPAPDSYGEIAIKLQSKNATTALQGIEDLWKEVFPKFIYDYRFLDDRVADDYAEEQQFLLLSKVFSALAIFISCLGLYGLISFFVALRKKEVGIRKVLGSSIASILILFTKDFFKLILVAGAIAIPVVWYAMNNWLESYRYRIDIEWWMFLVAIVGIGIITLGTISYQAIRAAIANPIKSLRTE